MFYLQDVYGLSFSKTLVVHVSNKVYLVSQYNGGWTENSFSNIDDGEHTSSNQS